MKESCRSGGCRLIWNVTEPLWVRGCDGGGFHGHGRGRGGLSGGARSPQPAQRLAGKPPARADGIVVPEDQRSGAFAPPDLQPSLDGADQAIGIRARVDQLPLVSGPLWETRSASKNPGSGSFQSA